MKTSKGIRRIDCARTRTKAWHATVSRLSGKLERTFSDGVHGGRREAYLAAREWYEKAVAALPLVPRIVRMATRRSNNRSGVSGVYRWPADGGNVPGAYWSARWVVVPGQRPVIRKFSVALYGERVAKQMAVDARCEALKTID
jgi:hypothetical protein